jgi:hypothetical protein
MPTDVLIAGGGPAALGNAGTAPIEVLGLR